MPITRILFDLDGTLVDSAPDLCAAGNHLRELEGLPVLPFTALRGWCGKGARGLVWASLRIPTDAARFKPLQQEFLRWYGEHLADHLILMPGVADMLAGLHERGIEWGIVTNKYVNLAQPTCEALGLTAQSRCLVGGDTAGKRKPAPDSIWYAIKETGFTADNTVYIGDDARDMAAARNAGIAGWAATWGYLPAGESATTWGAQELLQTPADILRLVDAA